MESDDNTPKAVTLIELVLVVIILIILAVLGFTEYKKMMEKGRVFEAKKGLGGLKEQEFTYYVQNGRYLNVTSDASEDPFGLGLPTYAENEAAGYKCFNTSFYFVYTCLPGASSFECMASRCTSGGKSPNAPNGTYTIYLTMGGDFSCNGPYCRYVGIASR